MANCIPPQYSPSLAAPDYSCEPACGECTLQLTPRSARPPPESTFIKQAGKTTVVLHNQEKEVKVPIYGRGSTISGSILFDQVKHISKVALKIYGRLESTSTERGARSTTLIDNTIVLWSGDQEIGRCPSQISFSSRLPHTIRGEEGQALPPSYLADFIGAPGLFIRSSYSLQFLITTTRSHFLTKTKMILIPFEYQPRTRPQRPIVASPCFFSDIKTTPEEWHQTIALMKTPPEAELEPIHTSLFVPSSRIYGIRDIIPLHIQLTGPAQSLRGYLQPIPGECLNCRRARIPDKKMSLDGLSSHSPLLSTKSPVVDKHRHSQPELLRNTTDEKKPTLRIFLLRQVTIETKSGKSWRNQILGEAKLVPVPPLLSTRFLVGTSGPVEDHLDWVGELRVDEKYTVGGWQVGDIQVKDFIALSILPQNQRTSDCFGILFTVPVKLVTDSWAESGIGGGDQTPLEAWRV